MCRNKSEGGHRCPQSQTTNARRVVAQRLKRHTAAGRLEAAAEDAQVIENLDAARAHYGDVVTPMVMNLPDSVHTVFDVLRDAGFRPLVVGGSVRDALTDGREPKDIDVEVYGATVDETVAVLGARYRVDEVGKAFGVLKVVLGDGTDLDVSVPRRDNHVGAGHRGFTVDTDVSMTAEDAAARRDFTLNSMGYDPEFQVCVDPYEGRADLVAGVLRATSEAFAEDPLRVLRGFQFAARYNQRLDAETAATCRSLVGRAEELPVERVRSEWRKFYTKGSHPIAGLAALRESRWVLTVPGLVEVDSVELRAQVADAVTLAEAEGLGADERERLVAAVIARPMGGVIPGTRQPLMLDSPVRKAFLFHTIEGGEQQRSTKALAEAAYPALVADDHMTRAFAHTLGAKSISIREWARLETVTGGESAHVGDVLEQAQRLGCLDAPQPDLVLGRDIVARFSGVRPGPWTGEMQRAARTAQIEGVISTRDEALAWLARQPAPEPVDPRRR